MFVCYQILNISSTNIAHATDYSVKVVFFTYDVPRNLKAEFWVFFDYLRFGNYLLSTQWKIYGTNLLHTSPVIFCTAIFYSSHNYTQILDGVLQ